MSRGGWGLKLGGLGLLIGLLTSCLGGGAPPPADQENAAVASAAESKTGALTATQPTTPAEPGAHRGLRVDPRDQPQHMRGLQRQPDGRYKNICTDAPAALRPAAITGAAGGAAGAAGGSR
jgi:hypothetical protein